jgi:FkbM family methyltransferase
MLEVGDGPLVYVIGSPEPDVEIALSALLCPGLTFYDVGANVGYYTLIAARLVGATGRVVAFEPAPRNLAKLRRNLELNHFSNVSVRCEALSDTDTMAPFALVADPTQSKLAAQATAADHIAGYVEVKVRRLDALVDAEKLALPDFIKMDIEGGEVKALTGAVETLRQSRPVLLIELHQTEREVLSILGGLDYQTYRLTSQRELEPLHIVALPKERKDLHKAVENLFTLFEHPKL